MKKNLFRRALDRENTDRPPVWFMRQAGRYHSHYQKLKERFSFIEICKKPEVACEATMGPIEDFDFDAAILFSDLLFPLEVMGMDLQYNPGPQLGRKISTLDDVKSLKEGKDLAKELEFQADAVRMIRSRLEEEKGLLGFVGGPLTLFFYAVEGSHKGTLENARSGVSDGRFDLFAEKLLPLLAENIFQQARAGVDTVAILDTCGGEISPEIYERKVRPVLERLIDQYESIGGKVPLGYYSKGTQPQHWQSVPKKIRYLGVDWNHPIDQVLRDFGSRMTIQGNFDPSKMLLPATDLEPKLLEFFGRAKALPKELLKGWVCGLGHGILPKTPEENVRMFLRLQRELFS